MPVIGVVPYAQLDIDSEDSVALVQKSRPLIAKESGYRELSSLKRLSNFTDLHSLGIQPDVSVICRSLVMGDVDLLFCREHH